MTTGKQCWYDLEKKLKECSACCKILSFDKFTKTKSNKVGLRSKCMDCIRVEKGIKAPASYSRGFIDYANEQRECNKCHKVLPFEAFPKNKAAKCGRGSMCNACCRERRSSNSISQNKRAYISCELKERECTYCHKVLPFSEFYECDKTKHGVGSRCKACLGSIKSEKSDSNRNFVSFELEEKECAACHKVLPFSDFHKSSRNKSGRRSYCKECSRVKNGYKKRRPYVDNSLEERECTQCHRVLGFDCFYKKRDNKTYSICKECQSEYAKTSVAKESQRKSREKNREKIKQRWLKNKDRILKRSYAYIKRRRRSDVNFRLSLNLRCRLNSALRGNPKGGSAVRDLGCSLSYLRKHLESMFYNRKDGTKMTWKNYGKNGWHIDHRCPLSSFDLTNRGEVLKARHYTNLQPLWAEDNFSKGAKIDY